MEYYYTYQSKFGTGVVIATDSGVKYHLLPTEDTVLLAESLGACLSIFSESENSEGVSTGKASSTQQEAASDVECWTAGAEYLDRLLGRLTAGKKRRPGPLAALLTAYFAGQSVVLKTPLDLNGYSDFTKRVYRATVGIGYGERLTYGEVARRAGSPRGWRAVGAALAKNRLPLLIPCHRVVKAGGGLGGWSGPPGWKERLLALERKTSN